jgi:hypothetical protein
VATTEAQSSGAFPLDSSTLRMSRFEAAELREFLHCFFFVKHSQKRETSGSDVTHDAPARDWRRRASFWKAARTGRGMSSIALEWTPASPCRASPVATGCKSGPGGRRSAASWIQDTVREKMGNVVGLPFRRAFPSACEVNVAHVIAGLVLGRPWSRRSFD